MPATMPATPGCDTAFKCLSDMLAFVDERLLPATGVRFDEWGVSGWRAWSAFYRNAPDRNLNACLAGIQGAMMLVIAHKKRVGMPDLDFHEAIPTVQVIAPDARLLWRRMDAILRLTDEQHAALGVGEAVTETTKPILETNDATNEDRRQTRSQSAELEPVGAEDTGRQADRGDLTDGGPDDAVQGHTVRSRPDARIGQAVPAAHEYAPAG